MELYTKLLIFYLAMSCVCAVITWFLTQESWKIRLLSAILVGATWPISFPVALIFTLL
ncbi:GhoT/OrtT family toxin [Vagococcus sp. WN89Y]|uniref:GhoT/OrtT family toxin n=1 Tax=Vagococcus sp. WN89Y TaxID=3457258 RepID=UPI003FCCF1DB